MRPDAPSRGLSCCPSDGDPRGSRATRRSHACSRAILAHRGANRCAPAPAVTLVQPFLVLQGYFEEGVHFSLELRCAPRQRGWMRTGRDPAPP